MSLMRKNRITVILSAGHGATDLNTGEYHCLAGGKEYTFPDGVNVREGDLNRLYSSRIKDKLEAMGYNVVEIHDEVLDHSLSKRANEAAKVSGKCCLICIHHNASRNHNAEGFEIFTTRGRDISDDMAENIYMQMMMMKRLGYDLQMRSDILDGDFDKEANFYELRKFSEDKPSMPACYLELEFFDYLPNRERLRSDHYVDLVCTQVSKGIDRFWVHQ